MIQSKRDLGIAIQAVAPTATATPLLSCRLCFDPVADRIAITNRDAESVTANLMSECADGPPEVKSSIKLKLYMSEVLESGSWTILTAAGQQVMGLSILPRRNILIVRSPEAPIEPAARGAKRERGSQPSNPAQEGEVKRG